MNSDSYVMRECCSKCASMDGTITEVGPANVVRCNCGHFCYNAPKSETGESEREISSRKGIKPSQRSRVFERDGNKCVICGRGGESVILHAGHVIAVADSSKLTPEYLEWISSDDNLITQCEECNLGQGPKSMLVRAAARISFVRSKKS